MKFIAVLPVRLDHVYPFHRSIFPLFKARSFPISSLRPRNITIISVYNRNDTFKSHIHQHVRLASRTTRRTAVLRENIYTFPNLLTLSRIIACPVLGWSILEGKFYLATALLAYAGVTDWVDGFLARRYQMKSVLGTILDPAADKVLMTTLTITLTMRNLIPTPLAVLILGRDFLLGMSAFYIRYTSLPPPKTFQRYWDFSIPSAEVHPTTVSKVNTALQLILMGCTTISPLTDINVQIVLQTLQFIVATTTVWSGLSYLFANNAVRILSKSRRGK